MTTEPMMVVMTARQWRLVAIPTPGVNKIFVVIKAVVGALVFVGVLKLFFKLIDFFIF
jgi:hypothetical protein